MNALNTYSLLYDAVAPIENFDEATVSWNAFHPVSMALEVSSVNNMRKNVLTNSSL